MSHYTCCVSSCKNTYRNNNVKFYKFPTQSFKLIQRDKWISAVRKINGASWIPKPANTICSSHFIDNAKSDEELSPSYVPTIFSFTQKPSIVNTVSAINRHKRYVKRIINKRTLTKEKVNVQKQKSLAQEEVISFDVQMESTSYANKYCHKTCLARTMIVSNILSETFICNRYSYLDSSKTTCEVGIQTDIIDGCDGPVKIPNRKRYRDVECNTPLKTFEDKLVGPNISITEENVSQFFSGIKSVKNDEQLLDLTGVTFANFNFLLKRLEVAKTENRQISKENRLFMFLVKIKTGLTFSAMSVIFCKHRTTILKTYYSTLAYLARSTADLVFWTHKPDVQRTMPACFHPEYSNTRVILDCTEFRVESPAFVDDRDFTYSHYKKVFTAKLLVGITPSGFISYKSKVAGGRKSDSQITVESGLLDLLEDDDVVLADKGFPHIQTALDEKGSKVLLIMPPFLENKSEFTAEETKKTYSVAKCRIYVERIMLRLRTYLILSKITHELFRYIDDIMHIICVLVNLQPPIFKEKS